MRSFSRFTWPPGPDHTVLLHETGRSDGCSYAYNASGQPVEKTTASGSVYYLYDLAGHVVAEINSSGNWDRTEIYAGAKHLATYAGGTSGTTYFDHVDWLGTERVRTDAQGALAESCQGLPFGDGLSCSGSDISPLHFTGKQHDSETGLDYFGARYDSSSTGRFMTPDWSAKVEPVPYAKLGDPQSLNLYVYVMNNPVTSVDAFGHCTTPGPNACGPTPPPARSAKLANRQAHSYSRLKQEAKGGLKVALGLGLIGSAAFGDAPGGVLGVILVGSQGLAGAASLVSGSGDVMGAMTDTNTSKGDEALAATGNLPGLAATGASGGSLKFGSAVSAGSNVATLAANPREAMRTAATAADAVRTTVEAYQTAKNNWSSIKAVFEMDLSTLHFF